MLTICCFNIGGQCTGLKIQGTWFDSGRQHQLTYPARLDDKIVPQIDQGFLFSENQQPKKSYF